MEKGEQRLGDGVQGEGDRGAAALGLVLHCGGMGMRPHWGYYVLRAAASRPSNVCGTKERSSTDALSYRANICPAAIRTVVYSGV